MLSRFKVKTIVQKNSENNKLWLADQTNSLTLH